MKIFQIVGYKNSGKTTLTSQLITELASRNLRVASLKHHGHGGLPLGLSYTDSEKHRQAGAVLSGVVGEHIFQLSQNEWTLRQLIQVYEIMDINVLVLEGFKHEDYPKIVLINEEKDFELLRELTNIQAIITNFPEKVDRVDSTIFHKKNTTEFIQWYCDLLDF
ncbi:molybdopterin-guanine dinucleotide biosynthesis protein B [Pallidibacillus pasinlerensis]|uniref:Molybdopterin-guanine dinucleotide biosynthesis protein B n=1 Tax=Pallidibacillus pasinlerensis TaxID=2703818 RepID=A0ABX0A5P3_9BACI|nr:molybdopterin-guanine dinucleotide biosynthesis protein B [Pallidibacillus pasinlerensis]NCU17826.1 molybdopterin-guanine dinucleotide biosynthesis protein B [Pallidibacillus pasinlerensis]